MISKPLRFAHLGLGYLLLAAGVAGAAPAKPLKMAVVDLPADPAYPPNLIKAVNSILAKDLRDQGVEVITSSDIAAAIGLEKQKSLLTCSEGSCLAEIGGALGVDYIVHGELASTDQNTLLTLTLTDQTGRAITQVGGLVKGKDSDTLVEAVGRDVVDLVKPLGSSGKLQTAAVSSAPAGGLQASASPSSSSSSSVVPWVLAGGGAVLVAGSVVLGLMANGNYNQMVTDLKTTGAAPQSLRSSEGTQAWASTGLLAGGVIAAGIGAAWLLLGSSSSSSSSPDAAAQSGSAAGGS